jgi:hypothetical protein
VDFTVKRKVVDMIPKKIVLLSLILLVTASFIITCDKKPPQHHTKLTPEKIQEIDEDINREAATLLSYKYNLDMQKVLGLLTDVNNYETHEITKNELLGYSQKYQIKINVIAAIIIDSRSMSCPDCTCDCSRDSD